jgi:hypothetical protein
MEVPSVFSKTGWVKRRLTTNELGLAWDIPGSILTRMSPELQTVVLEHINVPYKVLTYIAELVVWSTRITKVKLTLSAATREREGNEGGPNASQVIVVARLLR